jgi:phosphoglycolate phosphatase
MARAAAVASLGVCWGAHALDALVTCGPLACAHSIPELREWLTLHG